MDSWVQSAQKMILRDDPIFESLAWFFVIILEFIFTSFFEIKIHEKKIPWHQKNFIFKGQFLLSSRFLFKVDHINLPKKSSGLKFHLLYYFVIVEFFAESGLENFVRIKSTSLLII